MRGGSQSLQTIFIISAERQRRCNRRVATAAHPRPLQVLVATYDGNGVYALYKVWAYSTRASVHATRVRASCVRVRVCERVSVCVSVVRVCAFVCVRGCVRVQDGVRVGRAEGQMLDVGTNPRLMLGKALLGEDDFAGTIYQVHTHAHGHARTHARARFSPVAHRKCAHECILHARVLVRTCEYL